MFASMDSVFNTELIHCSHLVEKFMNSGSQQLKISLNNRVKKSVTRPLASPEAN